MQFEIPLRLRSAALLLVVSLMAACASVAVTDDAMLTNTSRALGLDRSQITISERADSGVQTTFIATTRSSKRYSCYVTGTVTVMGRTVSDAICTEMRTDGKPSTPSANAPADANCNALLRAAGRCK